MEPPNKLLNAGHLVVGSPKAVAGESIPDGRLGVVQRLALKQKQSDRWIFQCRSRKDLFKAVKSCGRTGHHMQSDRKRAVFRSSNPTLLFQCCQKSACDRQCPYNEHPYYLQSAPSGQPASPAEPGPTSASQIHCTARKSSC
jgi:hypothetical protein